MRLLAAITLCLFLPGAALAQHCGSFRFPPKQDTTVFQDVAKRAGARVFVSETGRKIGSAFLIDRELGLFLTSAHVLVNKNTIPTSMRNEVWLDFPILLGGNRVLAKRLPVSDIEGDPIDVALLRVETSDISAALKAPELHFKKVETNVEHHAYGFPGSTFEAAGGAAVPGWSGEHACLFDMLIATNSGDSGGGVFEPGKQLAGITKQQADTRRRFTAIECVTAELLNELPAIDSIAGGLLDAAEAIASRFSQMSMIDARQMLLPDVNGSLTNLEIAILVEGIRRKPERFCELANHFECPLFDAVSDRLGRRYFYSIAVAEHEQKHLCATAQSGAASDKKKSDNVQVSIGPVVPGAQSDRSFADGTVDGAQTMVGPYRLGERAEEKTLTSFGEQQLVPLERQTRLHAFQGQMLSVPSMFIEASGLQEQNAVDRVVADRLREQADRQERNGFTNDANDFRAAALEHYERYLEANASIGQAIANSLVHNPMLKHVGSLANYENAYENAATLALRAAVRRDAADWTSLTADIAHLNALVPEALRTAPGWQVVPMASMFRDFDWAADLGTMAENNPEWDGTTINELLRSHWAAESNPEWEGTTINELLRNHQLYGLDDMTEFPG